METVDTKFKIAVVSPWFGIDIPGGAEAEIRELVFKLHEYGVNVEVLTTCVKDFTCDWGKNFYAEGVYQENQIKVHRFKVRKRDAQAFDRVNLKLINYELPLTLEEEKTFFAEMINSPELYSYIKKNKNKYDIFLFISYMFGTTYNGMQLVPEKSVVIPCFHDEAYVRMELLKKAFPMVAGLVYNAKPEKEFIEKLYDLSEVKQIVMGIGMDTGFHTDAKAFTEKFNIHSPFILYAGRKDAGKNVDVLLQYFEIYKKRNDNNLQLVLIGGGNIAIPEYCKDDVIDLGFVDKQDKYNAYSAASFLCQPSTHESFSLVMMESWLCERPVLVAEGCEVTKNFCNESNGGLYFDNYPEFEETINYLLKRPQIANQMGKNGRKYVLEHFDWNVIIRKYMEFFDEVLFVEK